MIDAPPAAPRLSVVVPTYRAVGLLAATLRSLAVQAYSTNLAEIIVVDDGSPDFDRDHLEGIAARFPTQFLHFDHNQGRAAARNAGIRMARGDVIVFLDGDMTVEHGFLQVHDAFHRFVPHAAAVGSIRWGDSVPDTALTRYLSSRGVARYRPGPVPYKCFVTGNSSVPRRVLLDVGLFDEALTAYGGEDLELGCRLHRHGLGVHFVPAAASWHHQCRSLSAMCEAMGDYGSRSIPRLVERHPELATVLRVDFLRLPRLHPRRLLLRAALWRQAYAAARRFAEWGQTRLVPDIVFDYLWWHERTSAFLASPPRN